jgi:GDP-4-dehydro-6-deoxy-D-mannose reductase
VRILITGAGGFVGPYVSEALRSICGSAVTVVKTSKYAGSDHASDDILPLDVTDKLAVRDVVAHYRPTHVVHLAGIALLGAANAEPENAWRIHLNGALNVAQAILEETPECWFIHVGSGLVYGDTAKSGLPLDETALLAPIDDYAVTKAAADLAVGAMSHQGLKCIRLRPFNHTGPGQSEAYAVPGFAMQIARIEAGLAAPVIHVGNLDAERDFLDVRDIARAYALVALLSDNLAPNRIFNVASGIPRRIGAVLDQMLAQSTVKITKEQDTRRVRPIDLPRIVGDAGRARTLLGWAPEHAFEETLAAVLNDCRARVARQR